MPFEPLSPSIEDRVKSLNVSIVHRASYPVLKHVLTQIDFGHVAVVPSFGAEGVVMMHMTSLINPTTPIILRPGRLLFPETVDYLSDLATRLELDAKVQNDVKLEDALAPFDTWISSEPCFRPARGSSKDLFENDSDIRVKVNAFAHWRKEDLQDYVVSNELPRHPEIASDKVENIHPNLALITNGSPQ